MEAHKGVTHLVVQGGRSCLHTDTAIWLTSRLLERHQILDDPYGPLKAYWLNHTEMSCYFSHLSALTVSGYHADTPITIKAEPFIWPTAAFINIHEHPL